MQYQPLTQADYASLVVRLISGFEGHETQARNIGDGKATIGYGYTFNRSDNVAIWTAAGITLSASELAALQALDAAPSSTRTALALSSFTRSLSRTDAQALLTQTYPQYESPAIALGMPLSLERAAFVSLAYNRGVGRVNSMTEFAAAVQGSNRAEAWFQIRYNALGTTAAAFRDGVAKRRFTEAQVFGLYDNPIATPSLTEVKQVYSMLTSHRAGILAYEANYGAPPDGTNATRNTIALANGDANLNTITTVQTLTVALTPAYTAFISYANSLQGAGLAGIDTSILSNAASIYFQGDNAFTTLLDARADDARTGNKLNNNLLVGGAGKDTEYGGAGSDYLIGAAGWDVLDGGIGDDVLVGGKDNDRLMGGAGMDIYAFNAGDGQDVIEDSDGNGSIVVGSTVLTGAGNAKYKLDGHKQVWTAGAGASEVIYTLV